MDSDFKRRLIQETVDVVDHYSALEVEDTSDEVSIKKAYRKLVLKWHPDKHPSDRETAEKRIRAINEAYEVLSNPAKKEAYDQQRRAVQERRRTGARIKSTICVKTDLPRESILQPVGYPDKFVRYVNGRNVQGCVVQSRAEARAERGDFGGDTLDDLQHFFNATKLSFWWLPGKGNMCRIRAVDISTDEFFGRKLESHEAGGLNFAFRLDPGESDWDSSVKLIQAAKGQFDEHVNFDLNPSPYYQDSIRFESAVRKGHFLAFKPPSSFRVVRHQDGAGSNCIVDFTVIDFAHVFKFVEIEEVFRIAMLRNADDWISLYQLKCDSHVVAYFRDVLGKPMWDDEEFFTYFQGHHHSWELRGDQIKYIKPEERLGQDLRNASSQEQVANVLSGASSHAVTKLTWRDVQYAFEVLNRRGSDDISSVVVVLGAKRKLISAIGTILTQLQRARNAPPLSKVLELAVAVNCVDGDPGLRKTRSEAVDTLVKSILAHIYWADKGKEEMDLTLSDFAALLTLPGVSEKSDVLVRTMAPLFKAANIADVARVVEASTKAGASSLTKVAVSAFLDALPLSSGQDLGTAVQLVLAVGGAEEECIEALPRCASEMETADLASCIATLIEKGVSPTKLSDLIANLASRTSSSNGLTKLQPEGLLSLVVSGTKTETLSPILGDVVEAATTCLHALSVTDVIRLMLATSKTKGRPVPSRIKAELVEKAATILIPLLPTFSIVDIIKVGLAAGGNTGRSELLEAAATEADQRLSGLQPAQCLLLTQALAPLGGGHDSVQRLADYWCLFVGKLTADEVAKLAQIFAPIINHCNPDTRERCLAALGRNLIGRFDQLSPQSKDNLEKQLRERIGLGAWKESDQFSRFFPRLRKPRSGSPSKRGRGASPARQHRGASPARQAVGGGPGRRGRRSRSRSRDRGSRYR